MHVLQWCECNIIFNISVKQHPSIGYYSYMVQSTFEWHHTWDSSRKIYSNSISYSPSTLIWRLNTSVKQHPSIGYHSYIVYLTIGSINSILKVGIIHNLHLSGTSHTWYSSSSRKIYNSISYSPSTLMWRWNISVKQHPSIGYHSCMVHLTVWSIISNFEGWHHS